MRRPEFAVAVVAVVVVTAVVVDVVLVVAPVDVIKQDSMVVLINLKQSTIYHTG